MSREDLFNVLKELIELHSLQKISDDDFKETKHLLLTQLNPSASLVAEQHIPSLNARPTPLYSNSLEALTPLDTQMGSRINAHQIVSEHQTLMGRYYLESLIGQGGMGQVFRCYDMVRESYYALKLIHPHLAKFGEIRNRFLQELKANELLTHSGIVRTYTLEHDPFTGFLFFTMEYVEGITLEMILRKTEQKGIIPPLNLSTMLRLLSELTSVLAYAHSQGVIHRDLKPSNIMLTKQGHIKLMDFGIAKLLEGNDVSKHTGFGGFVYYMAPEQLRGGGDVTAAVDVFSLGVVAYQLLTGEIPMGAVIPPSHIWDLLTPEVDKIILKAMNPRPKQRYSSPEQFWHALQRELLPLVSFSETSTLKEIVSELDAPIHQYNIFEDSPNEIFAPEYDTPHEQLSDSSHSSLPIISQSTDTQAINNHTKTHLPNKKPLAQTTTTSKRKRDAKTLSIKKTLSLQKALSSQSNLASQNAVSSQNVKESHAISSELPSYRSVRTASNPKSSLRKQLDSLSPLPNEKSKTSLSKSKPLETDEIISLDQLPKTRIKNNTSSHSFKKNSLSTDSKENITALSYLDKSKNTPLVEELELEEEEGIEFKNNSVRGLSSLDFNRTALELPPVNEPLKEKIFYALDKTPLLQFVYIPEGTFLMGARSENPLAYKNEFPQRKVSLDGFWISRTPITNRMWMKFIEESNYHCNDPDYLQHWRSGRPSPDRLEHPVVFISIEDLKAFCLFYSLNIPTEAQWEKAARGTEGQIWPWGNQKPHSKLCNFFGSNIHDTTPVAAFMDGISPYGLFDCSGNVWEWTIDHWSVHWLQKMEEKPHNPCFIKPSSNEHAIRGGCFQYYGRGVRCSFRFNSSKRMNTLGARVILFD